MEVIGIIAEYNPFHNGHLYQINEIKRKYPDAIIVVVLNGYFLERGIISIESKEEKTRLALKYGANIVIELPVVFGTNSADIFADAAIELLDAIKCTRVIFGSESNDLEKLKIAASIQLQPDFHNSLKEHIKSGINYPTAINKALNLSIKEPNDILGVSYIKAITKIQSKIIPETIKRTNSYHDIESDTSIVSAENIRNKIANNLDISKYIPEGKINKIDKDLWFSLLKYRIITDSNLDTYLTVDEGIEHRLKKIIMEVSSIDELVSKLKTKRYTYNRIMRMLFHILIGLKKQDKEQLIHNEYLRLLGFDEEGQKYINSHKKMFALPIITKFSTYDSLIKEYELRAANIYSMLTGDDVTKFELQNRPLKK